MSETEDWKYSKLADASCFALGYLIGRCGVNDPAAVVLAKALKDTGVESAYVQATIDAATPKEARK